MVSKKTSWILLALVMGIIIVLGLADILFARVVLERQVDDVSPAILCEKEIIEKVDVFMVIPIFEGVPISENKTWCAEILALNKTLGMHGVYHTYNEFSEYRDKEYVMKGIVEFEKCFGFYPLLFEAPQLALLDENKQVLLDLNLSIRGNFYQLFHKVYHCQDTGKFSNKIIDYF